VVGKFPKVEAQADYHRKLGMDAGKIAGNYGVEGSDNGQFAPVFLSEVAKGKKFNFNGRTSPSIYHIFPG
jgi:hypothetical protein